MEQIHIGLKTTRNIIVTHEEDLIFDEKVVDFLYNKITNATEHYVLYYAQTITEITREIVEKLINNGYFCKEWIAEIDSDPEYDDCPLVITHASPYDHRWPGDYDEDAYDDWEVVTHSLYDFMFDENNVPYFMTHKNEFNWKESESKSVYDEPVTSAYFK